MANLNILKQEMKSLEAMFPKNHERFQIVSASVNELCCKFVGKNGKRYETHANTTKLTLLANGIKAWVMMNVYNDNLNRVCDCITNLCLQRSGKVMNQVGISVKELCCLHYVSEPADLDIFALGVSASGFSNHHQPDLVDIDDKEREDDDDDNDDDDDDDLHLEMEEGNIVSKQEVIKNLWGFDNLEHLYLAKNKITRIENLDTLVKLNHLQINEKQERKPLVFRLQQS